MGGAGCCAIARAATWHLPPCSHPAPPSPAPTPARQGVAAGGRGGRRLLRRGQAVRGRRGRRVAAVRVSMSPGQLGPCLAVEGLSAAGCWLCCPRGPLPRPCPHRKLALSGSLLWASGAGLGVRAPSSVPPNHPGSPDARPSHAPTLARRRAGWAGLIINAINCIPAGELDGARVYLGLCGRQAMQRMGAGAGLGRGSRRGRAAGPCC